MSIRTFTNRKEEPSFIFVGRIDDTAILQCLHCNCLWTGERNKDAHRYEQWGLWDKANGCQVCIEKMKREVR